MGIPIDIEDETECMVCLLLHLSPSSKNGREIRHKMMAKWGDSMMDSMLNGAQNPWCLLTKVEV